MLFICAEREREFPLHFHACKKMFPYFFAAGHTNYERYVKCTSYILHTILQGEYILRHKQGIWNGKRLNMMIETTFMKFGKVLQKLLGKQQIQEPYRHGQRVSKNAMKYYKI